MSQRKKIKVLVVEDNDIVRKGVCRLLNTQPDITVVAEAANGWSALKLLDNGLTPDIVIVDFNMPGMDGLELTKRIVNKHPTVSVIILTMHQQNIYREKALTAGAKAYVLKGGEENELFSTVRSVQANKLIGTR